MIDKWHIQVSYTSADKNRLLSSKCNRKKRQAKQEREKKGGEGKPEEGRK
jgi:hypothetical protein